MSNRPKIAGRRATANTSAMQLPGAQHAFALVKMLSAHKGTYLTLHVLHVAEDNAECELLLLDAPGTLVDVNFGYESVDVHLVRTGVKRAWSTSQLGGAVAPGEVYVLEIDAASKRARVVDQGVLLGAATAPSKDKAPIRNACIAQRKQAMQKAA